MALATYADLTAQFDAFLRRTVGAARALDMVQLCETELRQTLRVREMESAQDVTIAVGTQTSALPTGYVGMRRFYISADPVRQLTYLPPENFWAMYTTTIRGEPRNFTVEGDNFVFGPIPDGAYTAKALIWRLTAFTSSSAVPSLFTNHPALYLAGGLVQSEHFYGRSDEWDQWVAWYGDAIAKVRRSNIRDRIGSGPHRARSDFASV